MKGATTMPNELKPCPFCGGEAEVIEIYLYGKVKGYMAHCNKCGCELKCYTSKQNAKNSWNRRADNVEKNTNL